MIVIPLVVRFFDLLLSVFPPKKAVVVDRVWGFVSAVIWALRHWCLSTTTRWESFHSTILEHFNWLFRLDFYILYTFPSCEKVSCCSQEHVKSLGEMSYWIYHHLCYDHSYRSKWREHPRNNGGRTWPDPPFQWTNLTRRGGPWLAWAGWHTHGHEAASP